MYIYFITYLEKSLFDCGMKALNQMDRVTAIEGKRSIVSEILFSFINHINL